MNKAFATAFSGFVVTQVLQSPAHSVTPRARSITLALILNLCMSEWTPKIGVVREYFPQT